jgi:parallel beta-helix repeat protein
MKLFIKSQKGPEGWPHKGHAWIAVGIVFACVALAGMASAAPNLITGPTVISVPGTYYLANDITNSNEPIGISITVPNVVLDGKGFSIDGVDKADSIGIKVYNSAMTLFNVVIKNLNVSDWGSGIKLQDVKNSRVQDVTVTSNTGHGIELQGTVRTTIKSCLISSNGITGIILWSNSDSNSILSNTVQDNADDGIRIRFSSNNDVQRNTVVNNRDNGINLNEGGNFNTITDNTITGSKTDGIMVYKSSGNIISKNTITGSSVDGIRLYEGSDNNEVSDNVITTGKAHGIALYNSSDKTMIFSNTITGNDRIGIYLYNNDHNTIYNNVITGNKEEGMYLSTTSSNVIVNNNFNNVKNTLFGSAVGTNTWNLTQSSQRSITGGKSSGGNFWGQPDGNGFSQVTPGTRGICDQPYVLATSNVDRLPLK